MTAAPLNLSPEPLALADADAARLLSVSRSHFRQMVKDGRAPAPVKLGRSSRWRADELRAWLSAASSVDVEKINLYIG